MAEKKNDRGHRERQKPQPGSAGGPAESAFDADKTLKFTLPRRKYRLQEKKPVLRVVAGPDLSTFARLNPGTTIVIGRNDDADFVFKDPSISRNHAEVYCLERDHILLEDRGSTNGTRLNGHPIVQERLRPGDLVEVGALLFRLELLSDAEIQHLETVRKRLQLSEGRDPLTRLRMRDFLDADLPNLLDIHRASTVPISLVFLDLDRFKSINDTHGHGVGDAVLKIVAHLILLACRETDIAIRHGGEEFLIVLRNSDEKGAADMAERLRVDIERQDWTRTAPVLERVTASLGVAMLKPEESQKQWIERADRAMYAAKAAGRNCVVRASDL